MPVISVLFVGRLINLSKSLGSWVRERRVRRHILGDSSSDLVSDETVKLRLPSVPSATLTGVHKLVRNLYRSRAQLSGREDSTLPTFNDLTSADFSYHAQLKAMQPIYHHITEDSSGRKHRDTAS